MPMVLALPVARHPDTYLYKYESRGIHINVGIKKNSIGQVTYLPVN